MFTTIPGIAGIMLSNSLYLWNQAAISQFSFSLACCVFLLFSMAIRVVECSFFCRSRFSLVSFALFMHPFICSSIFSAWLSVGLKASYLSCVSFSRVSASFESCMAAEYSFSVPCIFSLSVDSCAVCPPSCCSIELFCIKVSRIC